MNAASRQPIIYQSNDALRFSDLDVYGHLSAKHYIDMVASSRLHFMANELGHPLDELQQLGIGFYLRTAEQHFHRAVTGLQTLHIRSWVSKVSGASLTVDYQVQSAARDTTYSDGTLLYVVVSLKSLKPIKMPPWLLDWFLYAEASAAPLLPS